MARLRRLPILDLYPLDTYLESHIGVTELYSARWKMPKLAAAVTSYLEGLPEDLYKAFLSNLYSEAPPAGSRKELAEFILAQHDPFDLHGVSHETAVATAPSLESVIASEATDEYSLHHTDAGYWLRNNATSEQCIALIRELDPCDVALDSFDFQGAVDIVDWIDAREPAPENLLRAWRKVREPDPRMTPTTGLSSTGAIRVWARKQGIPVGDRGRIPASIVARYTAATQQRV